MPAMKRSDIKEKAIIILTAIFIAVTVFLWTQEVYEGEKFPAADSLFADSLEVTDSLQSDSLSYVADSVNYDVEKEIH